MTKMTYLFFDVDGVLNREADWVNKFALHAPCVKAFGKLCSTIAGKYGEVTPVLISTWRAGIGTNGRNSPQVDALKSALASVGVSVTDSTPVSNKGRQAEVNYYLRRHSAGRYVVIDDDPSLFDDPGSINLYVTNYKTGLVENDIVKIIKRIQ